MKARFVAAARQTIQAHALSFLKDGLPSQQRLQTVLQSMVPDSERVRSKELLPFEFLVNWIKTSCVAWLRGFYEWRNQWRDRVFTNDATSSETRFWRMTYQLEKMWKQWHVQHWSCWNNATVKLWKSKTVSKWHTVTLRGSVTEPVTFVTRWKSTTIAQWNRVTTETWKSGSMESLRQTYCSSYLIAEKLSTTFFYFK